LPHLNTRTPTGGDLTQRSDPKPAFSDNLFGRIFQRENILTAWQRVRAKLKLVADTTKSHVVKTNESKLLGFTFQGGRIHWHPKTLQKCKQQVRRLTNRNWGVPMKYQLFKISQYIRGWISYFGIASGYQRCVELDHWIRRRVRMAYWRQW